MANQAPVALFELDPTDNLVIPEVGPIKILPAGSELPAATKGVRVIPVGRFRDRKKRIPVAMIETVDEDKFFFISVDAANSFMRMHGMVDVDDQEMDRQRQGAS